jgi:hypothetical protein
VVTEGGETVNRWIWPLFYRRVLVSLFFSIIILALSIFLSFSIFFYPPSPLPLFPPLFSNSPIPQNSEKYTCMLWLHPLITMCKFVSSAEGRTIFVFPLFYQRHSPGHTIFSLLWLFHPYAALFMREQRAAEETTRMWFFPAFYSKRTPGRAETALVFLFHPRASLVYLLRENAGEGLTHLLFLYWHRFSEHTNDFGTPLTHSPLLLPLFSFLISPNFNLFIIII